MFDSFGVEHIPEEIKRFIGNKDIIINIYRTQEYHSIMRELIGFMISNKTMTDFDNMFHSLTCNLIYHFIFYIR